MEWTHTYVIQYAEQDINKIIDTLFRENVKEEYAFWDYFCIHDSEIIYFYHYWTYIDGKRIPKYNRGSMKIAYGGIEI